MSEENKEEIFKLKFKNKENGKEKIWGFVLSKPEIIEKYINNGGKKDENLYNLDYSNINNIETLIEIISKLYKEEDNKAKNYAKLILDNLNKNITNIKDKFKDYFVKIIEDPNRTNKVKDTIKLIEDNGLLENKNYCKKILKLAFEKNIDLSRFLYNKFKVINWDLEEEKYKEDLVNIAINTSGEKANQVFGFLLENFSDEINKKTIEELFDAYKNNVKNVVLKRYFIKKLNKSNLAKLIKDYNDKEKTKGLIYPIIDYGNFELLKIISKEHETEYNDNDIIRIIKQIYLKPKGEERTNMVNNFILQNKVIKLPDNLLEELLKEANIDVGFLNKVISKFNSFNPTTCTIKKEKGQIKEIQRNINYDVNNNNIESIKDTVFTNLKNENKNKKLYEVTYKANGVQEITYYKKDSNDILAKISVDTNRLLKFEEINCNEEEIKKILNDNYNSIDSFDYKLSFLSYIQLQQKLEGEEENIIFKTNCRSIEDIVDIIENSQKEQEKNKTFICDFTIDRHDVQMVIENNKVNILNTGFNFEHVRKEIEEKCKGAEVKQIKIIQQSVNNCVEASKLCTVVLAEKYKENFKEFKNLAERLNKFQKFIKNTLNETKDKKPNSIEESKKIKKEYNTNIKMLKTVLETNNKLLTDYGKHFKNSSKELEEVKNIILEKSGKKNIDDIIQANKLDSIIILKKEIDELKNNNDKYSKIMDYIVKNSRNILENEETNKIEALKKNKILLKIIKHNIDGKEIKIFKNNQENIIENINNILEKEQKTKEDIENVFKGCIEEIDKLSKEDLQINK